MNYNGIIIFITELKGFEIILASIVDMNKMYLHSYKFTQEHKKSCLFFFKANFECEYLPPLVEVM